MGNAEVNYLLINFRLAILFVAFLYMGNLVFAILFVLSNFTLIVTVIGDLFPRGQVS